MTPVQLCPWLKVETPLGAGWAIFYQDTGDEIFWTVADCKTRAIVQWPNNKILIGRSFTLGLGLTLKELRGRINKAIDI